MAGATASTVIGNGYLLPPGQPKILIREYLGRYHVCERSKKRGDHRHVIVAECMRKEDAETLLFSLELKANLARKRKNKESDHG